MGTVSDFIGDHLVEGTQLEELLLKEYADEETTIEVMRSLVKLVQLKDETSGELGAFRKRSGVTPLGRHNWPTYT